jgi:CATRA-associated small protein
MTELVEEAAEALRWVIRLRLTPGEWARADQVMTMLDDAFAANDRNAVREAVFDLDRLARRVKEKLGQESAAPPSPKQRDRATELIHKLTSGAGNKQK